MADSHVGLLLESVVGSIVNVSDLGRLDVFGSIVLDGSRGRHGGAQIQIASVFLSIQLVGEDEWRDQGEWDVPLIGAPTRPLYIETCISSGHRLPTSWRRLPLFHAHKWTMPARGQTSNTVDDWSSNGERFSEVPPEAYGIGRGPGITIMESVWSL
jgi:hypothetical protein